MPTKNQASTGGYRRTALRRVHIRGYRSLRDLELEDLPDLVVLHGPNGVGKSNILRAVRLALAAATLEGELPVGRENGRDLSLIEVDRALEFRLDDFGAGGPPRITVDLTLDLGPRAVEIVRPPEGNALTTLSLAFVLESVQSTGIRFWFERADLDGGWSLGPEADGNKRSLRQRLDGARIDLGQARASQETIQAQLADAQSSSRGQAARIQQIQAQLRQVSAQVAAQSAQIMGLESQLGEEAFLAERVRRALLPRLLRVSEAYRTPGSADDPQESLYRAYLSEDPEERRAIHTLGRRLATAHLFGASGGAVTLFPVDSTTYAERQVRFQHPGGGELPLRNLGTGEQQVIFLLAQGVITPHPIALIEEPEVHLHADLMGHLARVLLDAIAGHDGAPDVDQLWIATHHHHFALAPEYLDVRLEGGETRVSREPRAKAARHFFEPGPIWEALRQLAGSGDRGAVVFRQADGTAVTAGEILDSIEREGTSGIAGEYARQLTEHMVLSMRKRAQKAP